MSRLLTTIDELTAQVTDGESTLDDALDTLDRWLAAHSQALSDEDRSAFSAALDTESTDNTHSLIDSVLKLHATRLLYRYDTASHEGDQASAPPPGPEASYDEARTHFTRMLRRSEAGVNEARIDIAIANAHHLLHDANGNRHWLDSALNALPDLANVDLVALAETIPPMPAPSIRGWRRLGLKLIGFPFDRLAEGNRESLLAIARLQMNQIVILAHLLGVSFEAIRERQRARRAFRVAAHLIMRYQGLPDLPDEQARIIAEDLRPFEDEAARVLADQARASEQK